MKNTKAANAGLTLIEILIVIAIIGILAAVMIPNLLGAQKSAFNTEAMNCARAIQTAQVDYFGRALTYTATVADFDSEMYAVCDEPHITVANPTASATEYSFTVTSSKGNTTYTVTNSTITGAKN